MPDDTHTYRSIPYTYVQKERMTRIEASYRFKGLADTFPRVNVALKIYLSIMVTSSGERSCSKLALIKNYLRTTMTHERLSALCLLDVESSVLKMIQFEEFIKDFSDAKCRKKDFL